VVRLRTAGQFYSAAYTGKWLRVMGVLPAVRFFLYTRAWRDASIDPVLEEMARLHESRRQIEGYQEKRWKDLPATQGIPPAGRTRP
jgi:hypothetical protein